MILHTLIDGLSIGVYNQVTESLIITACILIHHIPLSITMGSSLMKKGLSLRRIFTMFVFAMFILAMPLGILIGMFFN
jgi:zinc transporter ZupT